MARDFIDKIENEIDERLSPEHQRRYADTDEAVSDPGELREEQHREAEEIGEVPVPVVPYLTGPQTRGMLIGGIVGAIVGALIVAPVAFIPMYDLSFVTRLVIAVVVGAAAGGTVGAVYFGSRAPELSGESFDTDNTPSSGSTLADGRTDSKGR